MHADEEVADRATRFVKFLGPIGDGLALGDECRELDETGGTIGYFLIGIHAAAAFFHHYFVRDNTQPQQ